MKKKLLALVCALCLLYTSDSYTASEPGLVQVDDGGFAAFYQAQFGDCMTQQRLEKLLANRLPTRIASLDVYKRQLKALSPAPEPQTVSSDMKAISDFLSQKVDVHGARLAPELIDQFVEVVTPIADYSYRWKLNTGCKKSKEELSLIHI